MWVKSDTDGKKYWVDDSNYFATARLSEHFGRPLSTPCRLPKHINEKVEIEKLPHTSLPELDPSEPIFRTCCVNGREIRCQIVLGYREIYTKRQRIENLKEIAQEVQALKKTQLTKSYADLERTVAPGGGKPKQQKQRRSDPKKKNSNKNSKGRRCTFCTKKKVEPYSQHERPSQDFKHKNARRTSSNFSLVPPTRDKCEIEQEFQEPSPDFTNVNQIEAARQHAIDAGKPIVRQLSLGSHYMVLSQSGHQLDSEWLQLSASTDQEDDMKKQKLRKMRKPLEPWMDPGLNYASQKMFRAFELFFCFLTITCRNPFIIQPCYRNRVPMLHIFRRRMFIFSFSTIFIWMVLGFMTVNALDLMYGTDEKDEYQHLEYEELKLYYIPVLAVFINVFLAAFWSLLVLLHYCMVLANYFNLWSKAMPFLDMNPSFALGKYIRVHLVCYFAYVMMIVLSFVYDWPVVTRGTFGQVFVLIFRQMWPRMRFLRADNFFWGQVGCCIVYLYCVWVNRIIFMHMHTFSIILRNASYQWNLNFAIRFQLIVTYYRAHLLRIATQGNLVRLYNQHRLIVGLCNYYGKVFLHPLCIYMVTNMGVVTMIMIFFIRYEEKDPAEFKDHDFKLPFSMNTTGTDAIIYHTLPKQHELTAVFVVLVQCLVDFIQGTIGISWGSQAVQQSFEFVRRQGLIQCNTRHERRLIHSLYMSFGNPRSPLITADSYFGITKEKIFSGFMVMAFFWTMIIQCQVEQPSALIEWVPNSSEKCKGLAVYEDDYNGKFYCMIGHKMRQKIKNRTEKNRILEIIRRNIDFNTNTNYWFFEDCDDIRAATTQAKVFPDEYGMCKVVFEGDLLEEFAELKKRYPRFIYEFKYNQYKAKWNQDDWKPPTSNEFQTGSKFPCDPEVEFTWTVYYREFFTKCTSKLYSKMKGSTRKEFVFPVLFEQETAVPYVVGDHNGGDCSINPFARVDINNYFGCDGFPLKLDDCGSPDTPDFSFEPGIGMGLLFQKPTLKYEVVEIPSLPPAYSNVGYPTFTYIRCWKTFTALEKCSDKDLRRFCRLSLIDGEVTDNGIPVYGYLYGKFCYDFYYFTEFQQPNVYLFCRHPRPLHVDKMGQWIEEEEFSETEITKWGTVAEFNRTNQGGGGRKRRSASSSINSTAKFPQLFIDASKMPRSRAIRSAKFPMPDVRDILAEQYNDLTPMTPRKDLLTDFFPCKNSGEVVGWLPIPFVTYRDPNNGNTNTDVLLRQMQQYWRDAKTDCWKRPYTLEYIKKQIQGDIISIVDLRGRSFLDDCLNPWFQYYDEETFIPDIVFREPTGKLQAVPNSEFQCWDFIDTTKITVDSTNCVKLERDPRKL